MRQLRFFYVTYRAMLWILAGAVLVSWPGWWPHGSLAEGIASNVFATVVVTPFLLFGIDRAVRNIEYKRKQPRVGTIRTEVRFLVERIINTCASGTKRDLIPGLWPAIFKSATTPKAAELAGAVVVAYLLRNQSDAAAAFEAVDWQTYDKMVERAYRNVAGLRQLLHLADDAITHEDFSLLWKATRDLETLEESRGIYDFAAQDMPTFLTSESGRILLASFGRDIWTLVLTLCIWQSRNLDPILRTT